MIINGQSLIKAAPVKPMPTEKHKAFGVSWGLSEAGVDIRIKQNTWLYPGKSFALVSSIEYFQMPPNLIGIVHDKSTWARRGVAVQNTVLECGWKGWLTLELTYHCWKPIYIPAGSGIAQVIFHEVSEPTHYKGKYHEQPNRPVAAILE